jgi:hypothetical protein
MKHPLRRFFAFGAATAIGAVVTVPLSSTVAMTPSVPHGFNKAMALKFIRTMDTMHLAGGVHPNTVSSQAGYESENWSGYADLDATFSAVSGNWVEPAVSCDASDSGYQFATFWVGIDGFSDHTVEQDGTLEECYQGTYEGAADWWEMYPGPTMIMNNISTGDHITASVSMSAGDYVLSVTDPDGDAGFTKTKPCGSAVCHNSSAEWIAEAPCCSGGGYFYDLAHFKPIRFTQASVTGDTGTGTISQYQYDDIDMYGDRTGDLIAKVSSLGTQGNSFKDSWYGQN